MVLREIRDIVQQYSIGPTDSLYLYFLGQFAEAPLIIRIGELQDVLNLPDIWLLQLLADVQQLGGATLPESYLLQRTAVVQHLQTFVGHQ